MVKLHDNIERTSKNRVSYNGVGVQGRGGGGVCNGVVISLIVGERGMLSLLLLLWRDARLSVFQCLLLIFIGRSHAYTYT